MCVHLLTVIYIHAGVRLELSPNELSNNTLLTVKDIGVAERALFCSTDRNESNVNGNWFLPNGLRITLTINDSESLYVSSKYQAIGLNNNNSDELPAGVYHCEIMDKKNDSHSLFVGIYPENAGICMHIILYIANTNCNSY